MIVMVGSRQAWHWKINYSLGEVVHDCHGREQTGSTAWPVLICRSKLVLGWVFETSKATPSYTLLLTRPHLSTRPHLLSLPKQFTSQKLSTQIYELLEAALNQTGT